MKTLFAFILFVFCGVTQACDFTAGPGATIRLSEGKSGGVFSAGCSFHEQWELRAFYFGEQRIYGDKLIIDSYAAIGAARLWVWREGKRVQPFLGVGMWVKEAQRCQFNGDEACNRLTPLPFCFWPHAGIRLGDVMISINHCSNAGLDHGPESKNLGQDFLLAQLRF